MENEQTNKWNEEIYWKNIFEAVYRVVLLTTRHVIYGVINFYYEMESQRS